MSDLLRLLQQAWTRDRQSISEKDDQIIIGDQSFDKTSKTNYLIWGSGKDGSEKDYYTLETIYFMLINSSQAHTIYVRHALQEKIPVIRRPDRKDLLGYLNGDLETTPSIDKTIHFSAAQQQQPSAKKPKQDLMTSDDHKMGTKEPGFNRDADKAAHSTAKNSTDNSAQLASMSNAGMGLSSDKIAAIKAKFMRQKQQKQADITPSAMEEEQHVVTMEFEYKACRSRASITSQPAKNFQTSLTGLLNAVKKKESLNSKRLDTHHSSSYNRYSQEKFTANELSEFGITNMAAQSSSATSTMPHYSRSRASSSSSTGQRPVSRASQIPIIIVPPQTVSPLVGINNVQSLLENYKYVESKQDVNLSQSKLILYRKKASGSQKPYQVVDQPLRQLLKDDWKRVVCVFVHGPSWQFKNWPFKNGTVELFDKIKGIHCKWSNSPGDKNVQKMNVETHEFNHRSRHTDYVVIKKIWDSIDQFASKAKPFLDV